MLWVLVLEFPLESWTCSRHPQAGHCRTSTPIGYEPFETTEKRGVFDCGHQRHGELELVAYGDAGTYREDVTVWVEPSECYPLTEEFAIVME
ncbi:MAG: hypothetical protein AAFV53_13560 [Myxococcota bacterium]